MYLNWLQNNIDMKLEFYYYFPKNNDEYKIFLENYETLNK